MFTSISRKLTAGVLLVEQFWFYSCTTLGKVQTTHLQHMMNHCFGGNALCQMSLLLVITCLPRICLIVLFCQYIRFHQHRIA